VLWSVTAWSRSGDRAFQLGVKYLDGEQIAYFVFDVGGAQQQNLPGTPSLDGPVLTALFPYDAIEDLGQRWRWSAGTNVEGDDVDDCPDEGNGSDQRSAPFPG
jgi:hypothetical protein